MKGESEFFRRQAFLWFSAAHKKALGKRFGAMDLDSVVEFHENVLLAYGDTTASTDRLIIYEWKGGRDSHKPAQDEVLIRIARALRLGGYKDVALVSASGSEVKHARHIRLHLRALDEETKVYGLAEEIVVDAAEWEQWECSVLGMIPRNIKAKKAEIDADLFGDLPTLGCSDALGACHDILGKRDLKPDDLFGINRLRNSR